MDTSDVGAEVLSSCVGCLESYTFGMAGGWRRPAGAGLLERGGELERIDQAIAALRRGHGGVLVIESSRQVRRL
jgi:hypothetical protein